MQRRAPLLTIGGLTQKSGRTFRKRDKWVKKRASLSRYVPILEDPPADLAAAQTVGDFAQSASGSLGPYVQVSQAWLGTPVPAATTVDAAATQSVGQFTLSANAEVFVSGTASQTVGAFTHAAEGSLGPYVEVSQAWLQAPQGPADVQASQTVGDFGTSGTLESDALPAAERERRGGGAPRGTRRVVVRIDEQEFIVASAAEAQRLIAQAQALAEQTAREKAAELASQERVRMRTARRAAPVIRIEAPDVPEVAAIREQVADVNARIRDMYESALRTALIAREMRRRMEQDEEDALAALLI